MQGTSDPKKTAVRSAWCRTQVVPEKPGTATWRRAPAAALGEAEAVTAAAAAGRTGQPVARRRRLGAAARAPWEGRPPRAVRGAEQRSEEDLGRGAS